jgi:hypothetical protein
MHVPVSIGGGDLGTACTSLTVRLPARLVHTFICYAVQWHARAATLAWPTCGGCCAWSWFHQPNTCVRRWETILLLCTDCVVPAGMPHHVELVSGPSV